jgi:uncharacterized protein (DUF433 family)
LSPEDREVSKGIVVNRDRMGGMPTVRGTRITAGMIANLLEGPNPMTEEEIADDYDLTLHDMVNVKGWNRKGRPGA